MHVKDSAAPATKRNRSRQAAASRNREFAHHLAAAHRDKTIDHVDHNAHVVRNDDSARLAGLGQLMRRAAAKGGHMQETKQRRRCSNRQTHVNDRLAQADGIALQLNCVGCLQSLEANLRLWTNPTDSAGQTTAEAIR